MHACLFLAFLFAFASAHAVQVQHVRVVFMHVACASFIFGSNRFRPVSTSAIPQCSGMRCVRCGGDERSAAPMPSSDIPLARGAPRGDNDDDGMACMSYSEFDASLVCMACMQPVSASPPLEDKQKSSPNLGSAVMTCGLSSAEGRPLNGCVGTVVALEVSGRLRVRMLGPRAGVEEAIKRECTRPTLLGPPFLDFTAAETQQRGSLHPHSLAWLPLPSLDIFQCAGSAIGSDDHSSTSSASMRAYVAACCSKPTPTRNHRGGGGAI